jgi:hypothetical protein
MLDNCNWVDTHWQQYSTHLYTNSTQNNTMKQNTQNRTYRSADKSLARPTSRCILFDGENISFDASLVIYINSTNIPPRVATRVAGT